MSESAAKAAEDLQRDKHFRWSTNKDVTRSLREMDTADDERRSQNAESVKGSLEKRGAHEETRQTDTQKDATHTREKNSMADAASRTVTCLKATERLETYHHTRERVPAHATFPAVDVFGDEMYATTFPYHTQCVGDEMYAQWVRRRKEIAREDEPQGE
eukprot:GEMP01044283.1.p2 GENE.GEMP01044283.1~~GEMP01044283.1.p2  ORF type:complete len:159 (+),score=56.48 GEMP01044283.1:154-630(+)